MFHSYQRPEDLAEWRRAVITEEVAHARRIKAARAAVQPEAAESGVEPVSPLRRLLVSLRTALW